MNFYPVMNKETSIVVPLTAEQYEKAVEEGFDTTPFYPLGRVISVASEGDRDKWVAARQRISDESDTLNHRDMWGNLHLSFADRDKCRRAIEEVEREMDALALSDESSQPAYWFPLEDA